jgi:hypothetical protein
MMIGNSNSFIKRNRMNARPVGRPIHCGRSRGRRRVAGARVIHAEARARDDQRRRQAVVLKESAMARKSK